MGHPLSLASYPIASDAIVSALQALGIVNDEDLVRHIASEGDKFRDSSITELSIRELVGATSLAVLDGIGPVYASQLVRVDVWTPRQLAACEPESLHKYLAQANGCVDPPSRTPSVTNVKRMLFQARAVTSPRTRTQITFRAVPRNSLAAKHG